MSRSRIARSDVPTTRKKVAILGYTNHRNLAPFTDDSWEVWGLNDLYYELPNSIAPDRIRWFQLHSWREISNWDKRPVDSHPLDFTGGPAHPRDPNHVLWLTKSAEIFPVYLLDPRPEVPAARIYDQQAAFRFFSLDGDKPNTYFTNSISWMIALAIMEGFEEIGIWGVDMMMGGGDGSEYGWQRPSCEFFLGWARGAGIKVHIPAESDLLHCAFPYGNLVGNEFRTKLTDLRNEYAQRQASLNEQVRQADRGRFELEGARNTLDWLLRSWMPGDSELPSLGRAPLPNTHKEIAAPGMVEAASDGSA